MIIQTPDDTPEILPDFTTAARKALLVHTEKQSNSYSLNEVAEAISECMEHDCPETVVMLWGCEFALTFLVVLDVEGPVVDKLAEFIGTGLSFWDDMGEATFSASEKSSDSQRLGALTLEARKASRVEPLSVELLVLRGLLDDTFRLHNDKLPSELFGDDYKGVGIDERQVNMDMWADMLYNGVVGPVVYEAGREFASLVADELSRVQVVEVSGLCDLLAYAAKTCKTPYDTLGHLDYRSKGLMLYV